VFVIIAGSGKLGIGLARALSSRKDDVVVVDRGLESGCLGEGFDGVIVDGDPLDMEVLERSGTRRAELFIAVTADDNVNAACAQAARELFGVRTALARISDPEREAFYRGLGLGTVCPTTTGINQVLELILQDRFIPLAANIDSTMLCVHALQEWVGLPFSKIVPPGKVRLVGVVRDGHLARVPRREMVHPDDTVLVTTVRRKGGGPWIV
jgi:trk system potassium uptake protein TrkA